MTADERCFDVSAEFKTVHNRHLHIADNQINGLLMSDRKGIFSVFGGENTVSVRKYFLDELLKIDVVFHNEKILSAFLKMSIGQRFCIYPYLLSSVNLIFSYIYVTEVFFVCF